jgi:hypothetical protein
MHNHLEEMLNGLARQLKPVLDRSDQAMYIYLDDINKACNSKFASMLGYASPEEWAKVEKNFPEVFVAPKSQADLVAAYRNAVENMHGSSLKITWAKKSGGTVDSTVLMVPIPFEDHVFAVHFISP